MKARHVLHVLHLSNTLLLSNTLYVAGLVFYVLHVLSAQMNGGPSGHMGASASRTSYSH